MLTKDEAIRELLSKAATVTGTETVPLEEAVSRVTAGPVVASLFIPPADNSAMDGYAFRAADVKSVPCTLPVSARIAAGDFPQPLKPQTAARIFTGAPVPEGADTVIRQEDTEKDGENVVFRVMPAIGADIREKGSDVTPGREIIKAGERIGARHVALLAACGIKEIRVYRRLKVGVFATGNELTEPGNALTPGGVFNVNSYSLTELVKGFGADAVRLPVLKDDFSATRKALLDAAASCDLILTAGGVSVGEEDHVRTAIGDIGAVHFWKIAVKPGKPVLFGEIGAPHNVPVIALPGNPVSAFVTFLIFVRPFLLKMQGQTRTHVPALPVKAAGGRKKADSRREFLRARLNDAGEAEFFENQGSGIVSSLVYADGLVENPPDTKIADGDTVLYTPFSSLLVP